MKHATCKLMALALALVLAVGAIVPAFATDSVQAYTYTGDTVTILKDDGSTLGMMAPQEGTTAAISGDNVVIHYIPSKATYTALHWGSKGDATLTKDVSANADSSFDITLSKTLCGTAIPVCPLKANGSTTSAQCFLAIPAADKLSSSTSGDSTDPVDPTQDVTPAGDSATELKITNATAMFKAASATLVTKNKQSALVVVLNGTTYQNLIPGTYDDAVALGDNRDTWIKGSVNGDGKYAFIIPLEDNQTYVPVVSVSNTYLASYEEGKNPLSRAFYPRQFVIDYASGTLRVGDYADTRALTVTNGVAMFKIASAAISVVGGPNSNNYAAKLNLTMSSAAYDKAYIGFGEDVSEETETLALGEGNTFVLPVRWVGKAGDLSSVVNLLDAPLVVSFHSAKKDVWYDRVLLVDEVNGTLVTSAAGTYTDAAAEGDKAWSADNTQPLTITVKRDGDDANTFAHFTGVMMDGKPVDPANYEAKSGSVIITFKPAYLKTLSAGTHTVTVLFDDGRVNHDVTVSTDTTATISPATGDVGSAVWGVAAVVSLAGIALALMGRKRVSA